MPEDKVQSFRLRVVIALVMGAALSASLVKVLLSSCEACQAATAYAPFPHASIIGAVYYAGLAAALWRFKFNKYTLLALYVAAGCHAALLMELAGLHLFCIPCVICASCVGIATICAMSQRELIAASAVLVGLMGIDVSSDLTAKWQQHHFKDNTKELIGYDRLPLKQKGALPLFVFERKGCPACQDFNALYLPKLASTYGKKIAVQLSAAPIDISTPTVVLGGSTPAMWNECPTWQQLSTAIDANLHTDKASAKSIAGTSATVTH